MTAKFLFISFQEPILKSSKVLGGAVMGPKSEPTTSIAIQGSRSCHDTGPYMHDYLPLSSASGSIIKIFVTRVSKMGTGGPFGVHVHKWFHCQVEILLYLVYFTSSHDHLRAWVQWVVYNSIILRAYTWLDQGQECWHCESGTRQEWGRAPHVLEHLCQYLASPLYPSSMLCVSVLPGFFVILLIPSFWWEVVWNHNTTQQVFLILHCRTYEWLLFEWLAERLLCLCYGFWSSFLITNTDVYERLVPKGSKAGFAQLLSTQVISAVWHVCSLSHELWIMNTFHLPSSTVH